MFTFNIVFLTKSQCVLAPCGNSGPDGLRSFKSVREGIDLACGKQIIEAYCCTKTWLCRVFLKRITQKLLIR